MLIKHIFDFVFSFLGILIVIPLFIIIPLINKLSKSHVFFIQERIGKDYKPFPLLKFATMIENAHIIGSTITHKDDSRVTKIGAVLRKTKLNEIPQLLNVFVGSMSFVGPRPLPQEELGFYEKSSAKNIYSIKPGITGLGSLFFHNEEILLPKDEKIADKYFKEEIIPRKVALELWYVNNRGFFLDLIIFIATILLAFVSGETLLSYIKRYLSDPKIQTIADDIVGMYKNAIDEAGNNTSRGIPFAKEGE